MSNKTILTLIAAAIAAFWLSLLWLVIWLWGVI